MVNHKFQRSRNFMIEVNAKLMENIRNFVIISHIDAGKSTLADRFLERTGTVDPRKMVPQYLDQMSLERERGITIKMHPVRMHYKHYILNLIDTPGHADFNYEVSRSLAAVEGAILLVDATKGIQAQTLGNLELARKQNLVIIPVINKIDLNSGIEPTQKEISDLLKVNSSEIVKISAKNGTGIERLLEKIIEKIPSPRTRTIFELKGLVFDSKYHPYQGVVAFVRIFGGEIKKGEKIYLVQGEAEGEAKEIGIFRPAPNLTEKLGAGEIGYIATGIKDLDKVKIGDTLALKKTEPLPGYQEPQPMAFLSIYPENPEHFEFLKRGLERLKLNDAALQVKPESKQSLGRGFQCGFLGLLQAEIITERLKREFGLNLVLSSPSVIYKVIANDNKEHLIYTSLDWPNPVNIKQCQELWTKLRVLTPWSYLGSVLELLEKMDSQQIKVNYLGKDKTELVYEAPLREIVTKNFYDRLKNISQGFGSMDYEILDWRSVDLVKLDILILGKKEEAFSRIIPAHQAQAEGRKLIERLKEVLPPQLFSVPLQAAIGRKIIARETIRARRKDVTSSLYGGDFTRKRKLLEKQKKGKKELKQKGRIRIPPQIFLDVLKY